MLGHSLLSLNLVWRLYLQFSYYRYLFFNFKIYWTLLVDYRSRDQNRLFFIVFLWKHVHQLRRLWEPIYIYTWRSIQKFFLLLFLFSVVCFCCCCCLISQFKKINNLPFNSLYLFIIDIFLFHLIHTRRRKRK